MGPLILLMGTLLTVLFHFPPVDMKQSEQRLDSKVVPVVMVDYAAGSTVMLNPSFATADDQIRVRPASSRVREEIVIEVEGNVQDGFVLHFPAPT